MKKLKVSRAVLAKLATKAKDGTQIVCLCPTDRHVKAYMTAVIITIFETVMDGGDVMNRENFDQITIGEGSMVFLHKKSYDAKEFPENHKAVKLLS